MILTAHKPEGEEWGWVSKPRFGREGIGIRYSFDERSLDDFDRKVRRELSEMQSLGHSYNPDLLLQMEKHHMHSAATSTGHLLMERAREAMAKDDVQLRADLPFPP